MPERNDEKHQATSRETDPSAIKWRQWGEEAFQSARDEQKPVFLSISAVWCHWCHMMDDTVFSDNEIASFINQNFIPVRVDSDRRPDINSRYNQGGWPTVCFLTGEGEIIAGTTFLPADQLRRLLIDVLTVLSSDSGRFEQAIASVRERRAQEMSRPGAKIDASFVEAMLEIAERAYDSENGGFGNEPKFPYSSVLMLFLARLANGAEGNEGEMVRNTLAAMSGGGIYDQVEGGFFRYATASDWSKPHYEKMLEDNASLMMAYAEAYRLSGEESYEETARGINGYLSRVLRDPQSGAFAGSQDASEKYYQLDASSREEAAAPRVDRTVYSGWNALTASALIKAFQVFGDEDFLNQAAMVLEFVWENMWDGEAGLAHYLDDGGVGLPGLLTDTALMIGATLDAYESGAGDKWLDRSKAMAHWLMANLEDSEFGGFYDCATPPGELGYPAERNKPPVDNSTAAAVLIRLAQNTGLTVFEEAARSALKNVSGSFEQHGLFGAVFALALMRLYDPPVRVTIVGSPDAAATTEMIRAAHAARIPFRSVEILDPGLHGDELEAAGYGYEGSPVAYICVGASCQPRVHDAAKLPLRLESSWSAVSGR